jgi:hypothetical protein
MGGKYEILYWDWVTEKYVSECYTDSFFKAMSMVRKLEKTWGCVVIKFRRNKVKIDTTSWNDITVCR